MFEVESSYVIPRGFGGTPEVDLDAIRVPQAAVFGCTTPPEIAEFLNRRLSFLPAYLDKTSEAFGAARYGGMIKAVRIAVENGHVTKPRRLLDTKGVLRLNEEERILIDAVCAGNESNYSIAKYLDKPVERFRHNLERLIARTKTGNTLGLMVLSERLGMGRGFVVQDDSKLFPGYVRSPLDSFKTRILGVCAVTGIHNAAELAEISGKSDMEIGKTLIDAVRITESKSLQHLVEEGKKSLWLPTEDFRPDLAPYQVVSVEQSQKTTKSKVKK